MDSDLWMVIYLYGDKNLISVIKSFRERGWDGGQVRSTGGFIEGSHAFDNRSEHSKTCFAILFAEMFLVLKIWTLWV